MIPRVLVVEDDSDIRESLVEILRDHGYEAMGAIHGRDALDVLGSGTFHPSLIVLDLMMPVMDGRSFRQAQLSDPELSRIPVVVISAYRDVAAGAKDLNVASYLRKPLHLGELLATIHQHLSRPPVLSPG